MRVVIAILVVAMLLSTACAAVDIAPAHTANGLLRAVQNAPGTFMMQSEKLVMVAWPQGANYGFAVFTRDGHAVEQFKELASCCGTKASSPTMGQLVQFLKDQGWTRIYALPAATAAQIRSLARYFGVASTANFSLFLLPVGALEYEVNPRIEG